MECLSHLARGALVGSRGYELLRSLVYDFPPPPTYFDVRYEEEEPFLHDTHGIFADAPQVHPFTPKNFCNTKPSIGSQGYDL